MSEDSPEEQKQEADTVELGGNIDLTGFREIEPGMMVVIKKIVGTYAKKFSEQRSDFEKLSISLKTVHKTEGSEKYELHGKLMLGGKPVTSEVTDRNLFFALDSVMKKIENSLS